MKQQLRFFLSKFIKLTHSRELIRSYYLHRAKLFVKNIPELFLKSAWVRRSTVTQDFFPIMSDVDLTLVIKHEYLKDFFLKQRMHPSFPINDVQLIADIFEADWLSTGGFRNRQIRNWLEIVTATKDLQANRPMNREYLAFELGHEIHLLYRQLQKLISQRATEATMFSVHKLLKEMERTKLFWSKLDEKILFEDRLKITIPEDIFQHLLLLDQYWHELLLNLHPSLTQFKWSDLILKKAEHGFHLNLQIDGRWVFLVEDPLLFAKAFDLYPGHYVVTPSYITLIKGVGIQEQTYLNELAKADHDGYYFKFNRQRLYHDLLGAITFNPDNCTQLYYCFLNIEMFHHSMRGSFSQYWNDIDTSWINRKKLPEGNLTDLVLGYLDLLIGLS